MLKLIGTYRSRALRVLWALEEMGLSYEYEPAAPRSDAAKLGQPEGKLPSLVTDEGPICESIAILHYLADREGKLTHPAGSFARAQQDAMTFFAADQMDSVLWTAAKHGFVLPEEKRIADVRAVCRWEAGLAFERLAGRIDGKEYAAGDMFTVADIIIGQCAIWAQIAKVKLPQSGPVPAYLQRVLSRPALAAAQARGQAAEEQTAS